MHHIDYGRISRYWRYEYMNYACISEELSCIYRYIAPRAPVPNSTHARTTVARVALSQHPRSRQPLHRACVAVQVARMPFCSCAVHHSPIAVHKQGPFITHKRLVVALAAPTIHVLPYHALARHLLCAAHKAPTPRSLALHTPLTANAWRYRNMWIPTRHSRTCIPYPAFNTAHNC